MSTREIKAIKIIVAFAICFIIALFTIVIIQTVQANNLNAQISNLETEKNNLEKKSEEADATISYFESEDYKHDYLLQEKNLTKDDEVIYQ